MTKLNCSYCSSSVYLFISHKLVVNVGNYYLFHATVDITQYLVVVGSSAWKEVASGGEEMLNIRNIIAYLT